ncbi:pentatricopeptide repeat-containing protein At2g13600-like [Wolffia australiana]
MRPWPSPRPALSLRSFCNRHQRPHPTEDTALAESQYSAILQRCASPSSTPLLSGALHTHLLKRGILSLSLFLQNHLLNSYFKAGDISSSLQLFDEMPQRNVVSWSAAIGGLVRCGRHAEAISLFLEMKFRGESPNEFTLVNALNACAVSGDVVLARQLYAQVILLGLEPNVFLMNAFLAGLLRWGKTADAARLFEKFPAKDVVSWNIMLNGYLQLSCFDLWALWCRMNEAGVTPDEFSFSSLLSGLAKTEGLKPGLQAHAQLLKSGHGADTCACNSLADMYLKNQSPLAARKVFDGMPYRDIVSWTQMVSGLADYGDPSAALRALAAMMVAGVKPNRFTLASAFSACSSLASLAEGKKAHCLMLKLGDDEADACVGNALIDMYAKCGAMDEARMVFFSMQGTRTVISWTTMIMGFAQNGSPGEALAVFKEMVASGVLPNYITFICILYACSQGGFLEEGWKLFVSMDRDYGISPGEDHYACIVSLLGKAGRIEEAEALIQSMPFKPGPLLWQTLLAACRVHGDSETGKKATERVLSQDRDDPSTYILMSNIFAHLEDWKGVGRVRRLMENDKVKKVPGCSWIRV